MKAKQKLAFAISIVTLFTMGETLAQSGYFEDVLRYSQSRSNGSARVMGIGGTQTSLGGDVSNIHTNPAGLGFFRRSEFSFTGSYGNWATETTFLGQIKENSTSNFALPNLSVVMSRVKDPLERGDWRGGSFGISINRSQLFTHDFDYFSNRRGSSSLLDYYIEDYNNFGEPAIGDAFGLPLDVGLIVDNNGTFEKDPDYALGNPFQDEFIETQGSLSQITFAYGGNYKNKVFLGGSIGVTSVNFQSTKTFNEEFLDENDLNALYYSLQEILLQSGTGVNVNLGVIYKPLDNINLGLSFSSPTWTRVTEEFDADIFAQFYDLNGELESEEEAASDLYLTNLNMRSPMKFSVGGTYFFNKNGFITADIDYIDYSSMYLSSPDFSLDSSNDDISNFATSTINYRGGAEYRFDQFRIRAGAAFYGDSMESSGLDRTMIQYSGGIGMRLPKFYVDLGFVQNSFNSFYTSYPGADLASIDNKQMTGLLTVGFNF
jgi:long-subunit fatty acid transport protein